MSAGKHNFTIEQGADFLATLTLQDSLGAAMDLTGYTVAGKIKKSPQDKIAAATFTGTVLNQTTNAGQFTLVLTSTQTSAILCDDSDVGTKSTTKYVYDVEITSSGGKVYRVIEGNAVISPEVTK